MTLPQLASVTKWKRLALPLALMIVVLGGLACSQNTSGNPKPAVSNAETVTANAFLPSADESLTKTDRGEKGVTVQVTWLTPQNLQDLGAKRTDYDFDRYLVFLVQLDTHSGDLTSYDMKRLTSLRDGQGREYAVSSWEPWDDGSHHRSGTVSFSRASLGDAAALKKMPYLEIVVKNIAGVPERAIRWKLGG